MGTQHAALRVDGGRREGSMSGREESEGSQRGALLGLVRAYGRAVAGGLVGCMTPFLLLLLGIVVQVVVWPDGPRKLSVGPIALLGLIGAVAAVLLTAEARAALIPALERWTMKAEEGLLLVEFSPKLDVSDVVRQAVEIDGIVHHLKLSLGEVAIHVMGAACPVMRANCRQAPLLASQTTMSPLLSSPDMTKSPSPLNRICRRWVLCVNPT